MAKLKKKTTAEQEARHAFSVLDNIEQLAERLDKLLDDKNVSFLGDERTDLVKLRALCEVLLNEEAASGVKPWPHIYKVVTGRSPR